MKEQTPFHCQTEKDHFAQGKDVGGSPRRKERASTGGSSGGSGRQTPESGAPGARTASTTSGRKSPVKSDSGAGEEPDVKRNKSLEALFQVPLFSGMHVVAP